MTEAKPSYTEIVRRLTQAQDGADRVRRALAGIQRVNQLIALESDAQRLIETVCAHMVEDLGYSYAWIVLITGDGQRVESFAASGPGPMLATLRAQLQKGSLPTCTMEALKSADLVQANTSMVACASCPMAIVQPQLLGMARRVEAAGKVYGVLTVSLPRDLARDEDQQALFGELAGNLALALHRVESQTAVHESERLFRATFEQAAVGVAHVGLDGHWLRVNQKLCDIVGYSRQEILTKTFQDITHPDDLESDLAYVGRLLDGELDTYSMEKRYLRADRSTVWIQLTVSLVRDAHDAPDFFISVIEDIGARKEGEARENEIRERLGLAMESAQEGTWEWDYDTGEVTFDPVAAAMLGYPPDVGPLSSECWISRVHPADRDHMTRAYAAYTAGETPQYRIEFRLRGRDGTYVWVASNAHIVHRYEDGSPRLVVGIHRDISARKANEEALRRSRALLARAEAAAQMGSWAFDVETQEVTWSEGMFRLLGMDPAEGPVPYTEHNGLFLPEDVERERALVERAVRNGTPYDLMMRVPRPEGGLGHFSVRGRAVQNPAGEVVRLEGSFQDVTEQWQTEQTLRLREAESHAMLEHMLNAFVVFESVYDEQGRFISYRFMSINTAYERITGVLNDEVRGRTVHEVWPGTEPSWIQRYGEVAQTGIPQTFDMYHEPTLKLYHCTAYRPWKTKERFCVIFEDITERDKAEREIASLARFPAENPNPVLRIAENGQVLYANPASEALLRTWHVAVGDPLPASWLGAVREALRDGRPLVRETRVGNKHYALSLAPISPGGFVNVYGLDISERVLARDRLHQVNEELEERVTARTAELADVNKELEAFAYSVSHDLRSPLRAIDGYAHILQADYAHLLDEDGQYVLGEVQDSAQDMARLIDDLLAFSRMGRRVPRPNRFEMSHVVERVVDEVRKTHAQQKLNITLGDLPETYGDPAMLHHVWQNLVDNAAKFSRVRPVSVIEIGSRPNGQCAAPNPNLPDDARVYYVRDNGVGYDPRYGDKLFQVFQRLHGAHEFEGTGIGLAIVERVVHRHGGQAWGQGEVDRGATFYFTLNEEDTADEED